MSGRGALLGGVGRPAEPGTTRHGAIDASRDGAGRTGIRSGGAGRRAAGNTSSHISNHTSAGGAAGRNSAAKRAAAEPNRQAEA